MLYELKYFTLDESVTEVGRSLEDIFLFLFWDHLFFSIGVGVFLLERPEIIDNELADLIGFSLDDDLLGIVSVHIDLRLVDADLSGIHTVRHTIGTLCLEIRIGFLDP
jgi:hypothetical protein